MWNALHQSQLTHSERDLLDNDDFADFRLPITAGYHCHEVQFATCKRDITKIVQELAMEGFSGYWYLFDFKTRASDVLHWITDDGTPREVRFTYEGKIHVIPLRHG